MSQRRTRLLWVLAISLVLGSGWLWFGVRQAETDAARERVAQALGLPNALNDPTLSRPLQQQPELPESSELPFGQPGQAFDGLSSALGSSDNGVSVEETETAYQVHIPLAEASDASKVTVNVAAHHVQVSGQTGVHQRDTTITTTFMQSFSTSQEVLPEKVSRQIVKNGAQLELLVTVPKKQPGGGTAPAPMSENESDAPAVEGMNPALLPYPPESDRSGNSGTSPSLQSPNRLTPSPSGKDTWDQTF